MYQPLRNPAMMTTRAPACRIRARAIPTDSAIALSASGVWRRLKALWCWRVCRSHHHYRRCRRDLCWRWWCCFYGERIWWIVYQEGGDPRPIRQPIPVTPLVARNNSQRLTGLRRTDNVIPRTWAGTQIGRIVDQPLDDWCRHWCVGRRRWKRRIGG
jgi:hypothetical protein